MKKYELKYTKGEEGVFRMSTVESPATKTQLVMFSDELELLQFADDEKQVIYSVAMRPNMLIPRKNINGEAAMVFYSEETVSDLQQNFFKNNSHNGATINHDKTIRQDMYCFESWIVEDPEKDKAASLGLQVQKGDWVLGQKIDNPEVWEKVKNKELTGFSIEAYLEPVLIDNSNINMTTEEFDARVKAILMAEQLGKEYDVDGTKYHIDKLEVGGIVTDAEGKPIASLKATIDGKTVETDEAGVITVSESKAEEVEVEAEEVTGKKPEELQAEVDALTTENIDLKAQIAELESKKVEMSTELAASKKVALEMSEEMQKGIKPTGAPEKSYSEMSGYEKLQHNKNKR